MQCPRCQTSNPEAARFCMNCGHALEYACSRCGTTLPAGARFCINCGQPVAPSQAADLERQARLSASAPAPLVEKMRAAHLAGERKLVTALFADVVDSTALAENMDPEEWTAIMNGAFTVMTQAVHRYEGTIARLMGDALLAFFGAPVAHEDDPVRAIRAALNLLSSAQTYAEEVRRKHGISFMLRIGINTGNVLVGAVGSDLMYEYTAMGDAINLAARLQSAADPGSALVSDKTYRMAAPFFEFEDRGEIQVKGKSGPVQAYRVIGERTGAIQARGIQGLASPLVGRDADMHALRGCLIELRKGRGQVISIMGEAGIGKSRLVAELRASPTPVAGGQANLLWLEGRSYSYETTTPYAPFVDIFTALFELGEATPGSNGLYPRIRASLDHSIPERSGELAPFIASLMGITPEGPDLDRTRYLEPPLLRKRVFETVSELVERLASQNPLVLVFEDLHWADPTSLDLIETLMPLTERSMLLVLALFRPRREEPAWRFHEIASRDLSHSYTSISLKPLDDGQVRELVSNLLHIEGLPEKVRSLILAKADGNPFFVEELIRTLLDRGLVVRQDGHWKATREIENITVPDNLVAVISARLDQLNDEEKRIAQVASVIGREFRFAILSDLAEAHGMLDEQLLNLERRELIREKSRLPDRIYMFKHVLTQETAYASLVQTQRKQLHLRLAECLEEIEPDRVNEIARNFLAAGEQVRALPYLVASGRRAAGSYSIREAIEHFTGAREIVRSAGQPEYARQVFEGLVSAQLLSGDLQGVESTSEEMLRFGQEFDDTPMQVSALNKWSTAIAYSGRLREAEQSLLRAEQLAREYQDRQGLAEMFTIRCEVCNMVGDFDGVARYMGEAIDLGRELNVKEQMAYGLTHRAGALTNMTRFDEAWEAVQEVTPMIEELGHLQFRAELLALPMTFLYFKDGNFNQAYEHAQEGLQIAARIGLTYIESVAAFMLGRISQLRGEYEQALGYYGQSLKAGLLTEPAFLRAFALSGLGSVYMEISETLTEQIDSYHRQALEILETPMGAPAGGLAWADIGFCLLSKGLHERAAEMLTYGLDIPTPQGMVNRPRFLIGLAYVALENGRLEEADRLVAEAQEYTDHHELKFQAAELSLAQAQLAASRGNWERALEFFGLAETSAREMGMWPFIWKAQAGAAQTLEAVGRQEQAEQVRISALQIVDEIAAGFGDTSLREHFLSSAREKIARSRRSDQALRFF